MIINCFRCGKPIKSPDATNADYVIADDTIITEKSDVIVAVHHNAATLATLVQMDKTEEHIDSTRVQITVVGDSKFEVGEIVPKRDLEFDNILLKAAGLVEAVATNSVTVTRPKYPGLQINDVDYTRTVKKNLAVAHVTPNLVRVEAEKRDVAVQKTGIICPGCYLETDTVIWGIHKMP